MSLKPIWPSLLAKLTPSKPIKKSLKILSSSPILILTPRQPNSFQTRKNIKNFSLESKLSKPKSPSLNIEIVTNKLQIFKHNSDSHPHQTEMDFHQCIPFSKVKCQNPIPIPSFHPPTKSNCSCWKSNNLKDKILSSKRKSETLKNKSMEVSSLSNMKILSFNRKIKKAKN